MHLVFVSEDDLVRGPMARVMAQALAQQMKMKIATFDSVGVNVPMNMHTYPELIDFMAERRLNVKKHTSKALTMPVVRQADILMCMTHDIARIARKQVGAPQDGKILVLNNAIGFGTSAAKQDILQPQTLSEKELMALYSQLKASVGRFVRYLADGDDVVDFGGKVVKDDARGPLDDPKLRQFLTHYIVEFISRSFEPPTSLQIAEHLQEVGQVVSVMDVEEICKTELRARIHQTKDQVWEVNPSQTTGPQARGFQSSNQGQNQESSSSTNGQQRQSKTVPKAGKMSEKDALEVLSVTKQTTREDARKSVKKLLVRYHPDKFHDDPEFREMAEEKAKQINLAWAVLEDKLPAE